MSNVAVKQQNEEVEEPSFVKKHLGGILEKIIPHGKEAANDETYDQEKAHNVIDIRTGLEVNRVDASDLAGLERKVEAHEESDDSRGKLASSLTLTPSSQSTLSNEVSAVSNVLLDEKKLKKANDGLEKMVAHIHENEDNTDDRELDEKIETFMDRYTDKLIPGEKRSKRKMRTFWDRVKRNWTERKGFFSFFVTNWKDYWGFQAAKRGLSGYNLSVEMMNRYENEIDPTVDFVKEKAGQVKQKLKEKNTIEKEGAAAVILAKDLLVKFTKKTKDLLVSVVKGNVSSKEMIKSSNFVSLQKLAKSNPKAFDSVFKKFGVSAINLQKRAFFFELIKRTASWYISPESRTKDSLGSELTEALPIYGTYRAYQDLNDESSVLSKPTRYGLLAFNALLDGVTIGATIFSLGSLGPAAIATATGIRTAVSGVVKGGVKGITKRQLEKQAVSTSLRLAGKGVARGGLKNFIKTLPRKSKEALLGSASGKMLTGYAAYSGLSSVLDYLAGGAIADLETEAVDVAKERVTSQFTPEQKRLLQFGWESID